MLYISPAVPLHTVVEPVIPPGIAGAVLAVPIVMQSVWLELQLLPAVTQTCPPFGPAVTVMVPVPAPAVMVEPFGTVQL